MADTEGRNQKVFGCSQVGKMTDEAKRTIKLIAVYARVSTSTQENEGTIETQLSAVREFAEKKGYTVVQEYLDNGWSGDILARPQLDQLREDAKKKLWEGVLIYDPDRLARRYSYQELVMDELREAGVEVLFVTTPPVKDGNDKLMYGVKGVFAEWERMRISERFRLGKMRKVKEGHILTSDAPYGLRYVPKKEKVHGYYETNEAEIENLKRIFAFADEGLTLRGIVRKLQELGMKPRESARGVWSTSTLSHLLRNRTYIGEAYYGKSYGVVPEKPFKTEKYRKMKKTSRRIRPEEEWVKIAVPPVIERDLFLRVQEKLRMNFEQSKRNRKNEYLLAGKTWCTCGHRRTGEGPQRGKHLYYRCTSRVNSFPLPSQCAEKGINARIADNIVWQRVAALMSSPDLLRKHLQRWLDERKKKTLDSSADTHAIEKEITKLKLEEDRYNRAYGAGLFSFEKLKGYTAPVRERIGALEGQLMKAQSARNAVYGAVMPRMREIEVFAKAMAQTLHSLNFEGRRVIIMGALERVVGTQTHLDVSGRVRIENINHVEFQNIHRHSRSSERGQVHVV